VANEVAKTCAAYDGMQPGWKLPRTLMAGTRGMRSAGRMYLPQEPAESDKAYVNRLSRSTLFNAYKRTVGGITGKVFSKDIVLGDDVPEEMADWSEDVDLMGRNLANFSRDVFKDGLQTGLSYILVDMPSGEAPKNKAAEKELNRRPYFVHIKAEDMIGWKTETVHGKETLAQIRFREIATVADGEFGEKTQERIRVMWRDRYEVWVKVETKTATDEEWAIDPEQSGVVSLGEIPLAVFYAARTGFMTAEPPLEDLAYLNEAHWQSASDQRHILHVARVPILFGRMLKGTDEAGNQIEIGPNRMVASEDKDGDLKYVEHAGAGIDAGRQDLLDTEDRMRVMGLEMYMPKSGTQTATGKAIDSAEQNSVVKTMALSLKDTLEQAFVYMAKWAGLKDGGSVIVNTDYLAMTGQMAHEVTALFNMRMAGEVSQSTFWAEMVRRGVFMDDFNAEAEQEALGEEAPGLGGIGFDGDDE